VSFEKPGLCVNKTWRPGTPGTFAIVIGVSAYRYLDRSQEKFGLGSLSASALTASHFLEWLESDYLRTGCPIAKCWVLLAPSQEEIALRPKLSQQQMEPTFLNCSKAIQEWSLEMERLPKEAAAASRSVFFFSGHGLEVIEDRQILLPSDYLEIGTPIDRAISTQNISRGLKRLSVPTHFLFLDACRNDHDNLGSFTPLEGTRILNEPTSQAINPDCMVPIFYGSAAGEQSFSPTDPKRGISLLGEALMEGLRAKGLRPDCSRGTCVVDLHLLRPFVQNRVAEIVRTKYQASIVQRIRVRGDQTEEGITEVTLPPLQPGGGSSEPPPMSTFTDALLSVRPHLEALRPSTADFNTGHAFFGSERVTEVWTRTARLYDFETRTWLPKGEDFEISGLRRDANIKSFQFDLTIPNARRGVAYWLELEDMKQTYGCALPNARVQNSGPELGRPTRFRIEMDFGPRNHEIERLEISISADNRTEFYLDSAASMWKLYDEKGPRDAEARFDFLVPQDARMLQDLVRYKYYSPFAATIAGCILVRARRWDRLKDWLRNLANIEPYVADAQVLWVEQCLRQRRLDSSMSECVEYFNRLSLGPLPFMAETLGYALTQADELLTISTLKADELEQVRIIRGRLREAVGVFRTGGMFATYAGPREQINPGLVEPAPRNRNTQDENPRQTEFFEEEIAFTSAVADDPANVEQEDEDQKNDREAGA